MILGREARESYPEIKQFCRGTYDVTFPMSAKVTIGGNNPLPLYEYLTDKRKNPQTDGSIHWNFTKFLIGREGTLLARFEPPVAPDDLQLVKAVEKALQRAAFGLHQTRSDTLSFSVNAVSQSYVPTGKEQVGSEVDKQLYRQSFIRPLKATLEVVRCSMLGQLCFQP